MRPIAMILVVVALALAGCGGSSSSSEKVWCVESGEVVDAAFRAEYPDLYMDRDACEAFQR